MAQFYKTEIVITILSESSLDGEILSLKDIDYLINYGNCMGSIDKKSSTRLHYEEMEEECNLMGGDIEFFVPDSGDYEEF